METNRKYNVRITGPKKLIYMQIEDAYVTQVSTRSEKWAMGKAWANVAHAFEKRGFVVTEDAATD